jgi:hypothetical protein
MAHRTSVPQNSGDRALYLTEGLTPFTASFQLAKQSPAFLVQALRL